MTPVLQFTQGYPGVLEEELPHILAAESGAGDLVGMFR
jgi:hypothetical protein